MDVVTYALLKKKVGETNARIDALGTGFNYKGSVASVSALPKGATKGEVYTVNGENNAEYLYDGTAWVRIGEDNSAITKAQINALFG